MSRKINALFIGNNDNKLYGHAYYAYSSFSDELYEKRLIVVYPSSDDTQFSIKRSALKLSAFSRGLRHLVRAFKSLFKYGQFSIIDYNKAGYRFYDFEAERLPLELFKDRIGSFRPDIILFYWTDGRISSSVIKELANYYKCMVALVFVDQQYITGGCHFPTDCNGYLSDCKACPALKIGKKLATIQFAKKKANFTSLKKVVIAPPADLQMAKSSSMLCNSDAFFEWILKPDVQFFSHGESRTYFSIPKDSFVVMIGAASLSDKRKGIQYAIDAINIIGEKYSNITLLCTGNLPREIVLNKNINLVCTGWLGRVDLFKAFCASDCFLSSSLADSGPIMVNYAVTLGVPVVSFNIGTAIALVQHKKTGYIAEYCNSADLANGIDYIYNLSDDKKIIFSKTAKEIIEKKASIPCDVQLYKYLCEHEV